MDGLYGKISEQQLLEFKNRLHSKIHWLLIYKEGNTFKVDYDAYFEKLMRFIAKAGEVLRQDSVTIEILTVLGMAYDETKKEEFDYREYRHYVLEAHNLVERLGVCE